MWEYVGIWCSPNTSKFSQILFPKILYWRVFNLAKNTIVWWGFMGISQDYPPKLELVNNLSGKFRNME
jgi:hypothetical protein